MVKKKKKEKKARPWLRLHWGKKKAQSQSRGRTKEGRGRTNWGEQKRREESMRGGERKE